MNALYYILIAGVIVLIITSLFFFRSYRAAREQYRLAQAPCKTLLQTLPVSPSKSEESSVFNGFVKYIQSVYDNIELDLNARKLNHAKATYLLTEMSSMLAELLVLKKKLGSDAYLPSALLTDLLKEVTQEILRTEHSGELSNTQSAQLARIKESVRTAHIRMAQNEGNTSLNFLILSVSLIHLRYFEISTRER